jgi:hypothetical protein
LDRKEYSFDHSFETGRAFKDKGKLPHYKKEEIPRQVSGHICASNQITLRGF